MSCRSRLEKNQRAAKHYGVQWAGQWLEQLKAIHAMPEYSRKHIWFIAAGGVVPQEQAANEAYVRHKITNSLLGLLAMRWEDLHHAIDQFRMPNRAPEQLAILNDIAAGLDAWGYRKKTWFSSLRSAEELARANESMNVLQMWRVR